MDKAPVHPSSILKIEEAFEAPLSKTIQVEYNKLVIALAKVPFKLRTIKKIESTRGKVSVVDIIAYQIGWGLLLLSWYDAGIKKQIPEMPGEGFSSWKYKELAEHFSKKYAYDGATEQELEFYHVAQQILYIVEKEYQTGNLDKIGVWSWCALASRKQWPLSKWITVNTSSPYKKAGTSLRKFQREI